MCEKEKDNLREIRYELASLTTAIGQLETALEDVNRRTDKLIELTNTKFLELSYNED